MFSERTRFERFENEISRRLSRRREAGLPVLDLTESNPTSQAGLSPSAEFLSSALSGPGVARYLPDPCGMPETREAIAADLALRGISLSPDNLIVTASTSEAYSYLFKLLANPGDEILAPAPSYPLFEFLARLESLSLKFYRLGYDGEWFIDFDALSRAVTPRTRAVITVSPGNPTGAYLKRSELNELSLFCAERNLALICDEVFFDYSLDADLRRTASVLEDCSGDCLRFLLSGLSKLTLSPQIKVGWLGIRGPETLVEEALRRLEVTADSYLSASTPAQLAVPKLLGSRCNIQKSIKSRLRTNLDFLKQLWKSTPDAAWQPLKTEGGWNGVLKLPRIMSEENWVLGLLESQGVLVHPGYFFDFPEEAYVTVSLLPAPEVFSEGMRRIDSFVKGTLESS